MLAPLLALFLIPTAAPEPKLQTFTVGSDKREALIYIPATTDKPMPVVFAFHGHGGTMAHAARTMGYHKQWPEAVCVYMQGLNTPGQLTDPEGKKAGWQRTVGDQNERDLKFFDDVLKGLKKDHKIDDKRIYCTGHSNGGGFTYLLWYAKPDIFAAVAPSAAAGRYIKDLKPLPCLHVAGEKDPLVKYEIQKLAMTTVRKINGCEETGKEWAKAGDLVGTQYASKTGTPFVSLIGPGDHTFPTEAPKLIVKFFQEHQLK